jgi:hypothetical protein
MQGNSGGRPQAREGGRRQETASREGAEAQLDLEEREIDAAAKVYLLEHRKLVTKAAKNVDRWIAEGMSGQRAARELLAARACAPLSTSAQTATA